MIPTEPSEQEANVYAVQMANSPGTRETPTTFREAMSLPGAPPWKSAIENELENLRRKCVWKVRLYHARDTP
ncbi:uncharacterized protein VP01_289g4 [Puccinia sorghi]|uniref:Reverse transcriptase Ty1/copia-type domain-containing protein n=1 Tax=Puccinia sorghi TaxID=27349 RepID=A0A0L6V283_9BASI|nr:uncharacterized protein VP01_289g4 [Puccinia sorghi]